MEKYENVKTQIRINSPRYAAITQPQPLSLKEIQQQVLDENTLLLEYSLGKDKSYLWAVGKTENGFLRLHDVFNLNLSADLVVLSACQTGLGEQIKGEGVVGLTTGFFYAGSPRVVMSLWNVDDEATSVLMSKFYEKMLKQNLKPAAALRQAQIEMFNDKEFSKPDFWAAFTVQGEWR